jgi:formylglycine-generating enzyme
MKRRHLFHVGLAGLAGIALFAPCAAFAAVSINWVTVGDAGNAADTTGYGAVGYEFRIAEHEATLGQYTEFLNAKAQTDDFGLYNVNMELDTTKAGIARAGVPGSYSYSVIGTSTRPVVYVSWFDAARFCNWLHNGQGTGDTESGAYALGGATSGVNFSSAANALYRLPTEDEWYKAAYYDPTKGGSGGYWLYPTQSDTLAGNTIGEAASANYNDGNYAKDQNGLPTYLSDVGAYGSNSESYYGTFDQGGNVWELNDAVIGSARGQRGGSWTSPVLQLGSSVRITVNPTTESNGFGFRLASIPEPSSILMVVMGAVACAAWRRHPSL